MYFCRIANIKLKSHSKIHAKDPLNVGYTQPYRSEYVKLLYGSR